MINHTPIPAVFTEEDAHSLTIMGGIALTAYSQLLMDGRLDVEAAKIATRETLQDLYPHASSADITIATANAMACFIGWNRYLELRSEGLKKVIQ